MKFTLLTAAFALFLTAPAQAETFETTTPPKMVMATEHTMEEKIEAPAIKAVAFHSDSCGSCKIIGPRMMEAITIINPAKLSMVKFDFTNKQSIAATKELAKKANVDNILQKYGAKTGFVVLVNNAGDVVDTIKVDHDTSEIASKLAMAIANAS